MAKRTGEKIKLVSSAGTKHYYTSTKSRRASSAKIELRKFDPVIRRYVIYREGKIN